MNGHQVFPIFDDASGLISYVKHDYIGVFLLHGFRVTFDSSIMIRQARSNDPKDFMRTLWIK